MAQIEKKMILKPNVEILSIADYREKYQPDITPQAVSYCMDNDKIDYVRIGHERLVVMTEKTKQYSPNSHEAVVPKKAKKIKTKKKAKALAV